MLTVNNSNSTQLIETVSIDYDDFNDTFLTCATCLCVYDGGEHAPKLLSCSHTVCVHCLTRIVSAANNRRTTLDTLNNGRGGSNSNNILQSRTQRDSQNFQQQQTFRCPICRELIVVPQNGGILALPPSFLVNQLLDLISTHRQRTLIPSCGGGGTLNSHVNQELLYCETCDQVFCSICTKHDSKSVGNNLMSPKSLPMVHTVIPVSVAMKRTSEIMLYKVNECVLKLNSSRDEVLVELNRLDTSRNECLTTLDKTFSDLMSIIEDRKRQLQSQVHKAYDFKNITLNQQLSSLEIEKTKILDECANVNQLIDVQSINQQIQMLNDRLQQLPTIEEPRENAFIALDLDIIAIKNVVKNTVGQMGCVRTSTTCSSHCILDIASNGNFPRLVDVRIAILTAVDYDGNRRTLGGDPVTVNVIGPLEEETQQDSTVRNNLGYQRQENNTSDCVRVIDKKNGQYIIRLCSTICGRYRLNVYILGRPVSCNGSTGYLNFSITKSIDPMYQYKKGPLLKQPAAIIVDSNSSKVYVLDTGNCRIRVLDTNLDYISDIQNDSMRGRSSTGIALLSDHQTLVTVNWRTNTITLMTLGGETIKSWTHSNMVEPMCVVVDQIYDHILIGDSSCNVHAFKAKTSQHLFTIESAQNNGKSIECNGTFMAIGRESQIIVINRVSAIGCRCLNIYSSNGAYERSITISVATTDKSSQSYCSLATCKHFILASRRYNNSFVIDLIDMNTEQLINTVDSNACKLRRPAGMVAFTENQDSESITDEKQMSRHLSYYLLVTDVATHSINKYHFF